MSVTVITATTGNKRLPKCVDSVAKQEYENVQHLVFIDGLRPGIEELFITPDERDAFEKVNFIQLPYSVGKDRWNGHRMYAAGAFLAEGDYVLYLDDDNWLEPNHISSLVKVIERGNDWAFSFRKIIDSDGSFICNDDCESLGKWASVLHPKDFFIDVNCYFIPTKIAVHLGPAWYRKFREPGKPEVDRVLAQTLMVNGIKFDSNYDYTVNYTVGNTENSVKAEFFERGNEEMMRRHNNNLPWINR